MRHTHLDASALTVAAMLSLTACGNRERTQPTAPKDFSTPQFTVASGLTRTQLASGTVERFHVNSEYQGHRVELKSHEASDVVVNSTSVAPGGDTGWHSHAGPVFVVVTAGIFTMYHGDDLDCQPMTYPAGTVFIEPGGLEDVHIGRNEGTTTLSWVATTISPVGVASRIDRQRPGNCAF